MAGEIVDAAIAYREMLAADPDHVEALHYLGVVLHQQGDTAESIEMILRALQLDASSPERYNDLGNILTENGRFAEARQAFSAALELNATDANLWNNLGSVLHRLNEFPEAENRRESDTRGNGRHKARRFPAPGKIVAASSRTARSSSLMAVTVAVALV